MQTTQLNTRIHNLYSEAERLQDRGYFPAADECKAAARRLERQRSRRRIAPMTDFERSTLGTWKRGDDTLTASAIDDRSVRLTNSAGEDWSVSVREWMSRYDGIRDAGFTRAQKTKTTFRSLLQDIVCDRYADDDAAFAAIQAAREAGTVTEIEARTLERRIDPYAG